MDLTQEMFEIELSLLFGVFTRRGGKKVLKLFLTNIELFEVQLN